MFRVLIFVFLVACLVGTQAQLTFTSSWGGKRSVGPISCRHEEAVAHIYKMIQVKYYSFILNYIVYRTETSRRAAARSVTVKPTGCGFDPHSRR